MMQLTALQECMEARSFSNQFTGQALAVEAGATLLSAACREVHQSDMLRTLLKVAQLAGELARRIAFAGLPRGL